MLCFEDNPGLITSLNVQAKRGRPRIEEDQPSLLETIVDIAMHGSASHERRQSDVYRSIKTLDQLTEQLKMDGFTISRTGLYLRLCKSAVHLLKASFINQQSLSAGSSRLRHRKADLTAV